MAYKAKVRLAVLSDIHGNLPALEAVLADMRQFTVDGAILAGDYTGGPQPMETIGLLRSLDGWMICGNGDTDLVQYDRGDAPPPWYLDHQFALMRWAYDRLDEETLAFLASLPAQRTVALDGATPIRVVHGSPASQTEGLLPKGEPSAVDLALSQIDEPVLVCGHTHCPWKWERGGRLALSPGAVCGPLDGTIGAQYALLAWDGRQWGVEHHEVPYDLGRLRSAFVESGLLAEGGALARALLLCLITGENVWREFLTYARGLAAQAGLGKGGTVPDPIWERAEASFDWERSGACAF
jgi:predicted phosphodiesterase